MVAYEAEVDDDHALCQQNGRVCAFVLRDVQRRSLRHLSPHALDAKGEDGRPWPVVLRSNGSGKPGRRRETA
jgi:hypothetical protein